MKKLSLTLFALLISLVTNAEPVEIKGIYYNLITKAKIAEVTYNDEKAYSGNIVIPETVTYGGIVYNVTSIGKYAFWYDRELTSVTMPNSIVSIGEGAFNNCTGLTSISLPNSISSMDERVFQGCSALTAVSIPNTITILKEACFEGCKKLNSVILPNSIKTIESSVFAYCTNLQSIVLPDDLTSIGQYCFIECQSLTSISIPQSVNRIGNQAFGYCYALTSIELPNALNEISRACFIGCKNLSSFIIPNSVTILRYSSFEGCSLLKEINIPNSVSIIENNVFSRCNALKTIYIGNQISQIESKAFAECTELIDVYCYAETVPSTASDAFAESYIEQTSLHVPEASLENYKNTEPWSSFGKKVGLSGGGGTKTPKCATPTISYQNGKLSFKCSTDGVEFVTDITDTDIKKHYDATISLTATYNISVYATKTGYENSDVATATLCWIETTPQTEGISNGVAQVSARAVMIQSLGGSLDILGVEDGTSINVYDANGTQVGSAISRNGQATVNTILQAGSVAIVKIGQKSVKVVMK